MNTLKTTLAFIIENNQILLAQKKKGFGKGRFNGVGGKLLENETFEDAMIRENEEEININTLDYIKVAEINFDEFVLGQQTLVEMKVYLIKKYEGQISESDEMKPYWFELNNIPYNKLFPDAKYWLPKVLAGDKITANFTFDKDFNILNYNIQKI